MAIKIYKASRIAEGNRIFPAEIHIGDTEITLKFPGFFSGKLRHIVYRQIEGVNIDTPMIGYSTITFVVGGERVSGHGFTRSEAKEIKKICSQKVLENSPQRQSDLITKSMSSVSSLSGNRVPVSIADELKKMKELLDAGVITRQEFETQKAKLLSR